jgi:putative membrane protein
MHANMMNSGGFWGGPMWGFWVILILVVVFIYYLLPSKSNAEYTVKEKSALDIVKARYAKGEIDETAFKKMTENLKLTE